MKVDIFSHCTIDTIIVNDSSYQLPGGAACYCSFTARNLNFDVKLHTKFGKDFPINKILEKKIELENGLTEKPTTRFTLRVSGPDRTLLLENVCDPIEYSSIASDGVIISPLFQEISKDIFKKIKQDCNFIFLDPQGFLRRTDSNRNVFLQRTEIDLTKISAIKTNSDELSCLTGNADVEGMKLIQSRGVEYVILTNKRDISLLTKDKIYSITLPNIQIYDTTGIGDIFCASFCCTMIKEKDFVWALSFAGGAAQAALETKSIGLDKIPQKGAIETNASYFYNQIKFRQV
jgi:sugar/nucleoside kinase (ribokinase family)